MRKDIMVDIETLGVSSDSTIFQIAAVAFNIKTGEHYSKFNQVADIARNDFLDVDGSTLKWWLNTNKELLTELLNKGVGSSENLLTNFHSWLTSHSNDMKNIYFWGNGILFDNKMIQHQFNNIGLDYPIHYKNDRDVRTILELASLKTGVGEDELKKKYHDSNLVAHNALDDCKKQIKLVVGCYNEIMCGNKQGRQ